MELHVLRLDRELPLPSYAHAGDAGMDLYVRERVLLRPSERTLLPTGIAVAIPEGWVGLIHPRSGLAAKHGLTVLNTPGTIDAGFRGEIKVILVNLGEDVVVLERGDRIAQMVIQKVETANIVEVDSLDETVRGEGGFGSSGGHETLN